MEQKTWRHPYPWNQKWTRPDLDLVACNLVSRADRSLPWSAQKYPWSMILPCLRSYLIVIKEVRCRWNASQTTVSIISTFLVDKKTEKEGPIRKRERRSYQRWASGDFRNCLKQPVLVNRMKEMEDEVMWVLQSWPKARCHRGMNVTAVLGIQSTTRRVVF